MTRTTNIQFTGEAGRVDCALDWPEGEVKGWALVLHPHPLHGGTRNNKVVTTLARACVQQGLLAVRPDFRGIGESEGSFDNAVGETADMQALVNQFQATYPDISRKNWVLAGFSFGTSVAAQLYSVLKETQARVPDALILTGPAVERFRFRELNLPADTYLLHGEQDEVVPLSEAMDFARSQNLTLTVIPDSTHFFHGKLVQLRDSVVRQLRLLPTQKTS